MTQTTDILLIQRREITNVFECDPNLSLVNMLRLKPQTSYFNTKKNDCQQSPLFM